MTKTIEKTYDWKITIKKMIYKFLIVGVPAGILAVVPIIEQLEAVEPVHAATFALIASVITGIANYIKHNYK